MSSPINQTYSFNNSQEHFDATRKDLCRQLVKSLNPKPKAEESHAKVIKCMEKFYQDLNKEV